METIEDYDEYCHYVAGLVGLGLSKLFYVSKLEKLAPDHLSNSMGLFLQVFKHFQMFLCNLNERIFFFSKLELNFLSIQLQKTNIIRDYLEDINEIPNSRMFWPKDIWTKYANILEVLQTSY